MILADTSLWVEHFVRGHARLAEALESADVATHPIVIGELACGNLPRRNSTLAALQALPTVQEATHEEALTFIARHALHGRGVGYADIILLASVRLTPHTLLGTLDRRLARVAEALGVLWSP